MHSLFENLITAKTTISKVGFNWDHVVYGLYIVTALCAQGGSNVEKRLTVPYNKISGLFSISSRPFWNTGRFLLTAYLCFHFSYGKMSFEARKYLLSKLDAHGHCNLHFVSPIKENGKFSFGHLHVLWQNVYLINRVKKVCSIPATASEDAL